MQSIGVFVGRFQPLHNGHVQIINKCISENDKTIIVIGSYGIINERNPFSFELRKQFIESCFDNVIIEKIEDYNDDNVWSNKLIEIISKYKSNEIIKLYGPKKDTNTAKYIDLLMGTMFFNEYVVTELMQNNKKILDATTIRSIIKNNKSNFAKECINVLPNIVSELIIKNLHSLEMF